MPVMVSRHCGWACHDHKREAKAAVSVFVIPGTRSDLFALIAAVLMLEAWSAKSTDRRSVVWQVLEEIWAVALVMLSSSQSRMLGS